MAALASESKLLAKHSSIYAVGGMLNRFVGFFMLPLYTRYLTPTDYGIQEIVGLSTDVVATLITHAISDSVLRFYFEYDDEKDRNEVISTAMISLALVGLVVLLIPALFARPLAGALLDNRDLYVYFWLSFTTLWFRAINGITFSLLRARQQSIRFTVITLVQLVLVIGLNIYFIVYKGAGVKGILMSAMFGAVAIFFMVSVPTLCQVGLHFSKKKAMELLRYGMPLVPGNIGRVIVNLSDRYFLKAYASIADAGLYSLGYRFGVLPGVLISQPFNQTWFPRRLEIAKREDAHFIFARICTYFLFIVLFAGLGIAALSREVIMILADPRYWGAAAVVPIIVLGNMMFTLTYHLQVGLILEKQSKYLGMIDFSNAGLVLLWNFLLIPRYGMYGAAFATVLAFLYKMIMTWYFANRVHPISFEWGRMAKLFLVAGGMYAGIQFIDIENLYISVAVKTGLVLLFPLVLVALGFFKPDELAMARNFWRTRIRRKT